jgi:hypothetical protein
MKMHELRQKWEELGGDLQDYGDAGKEGWQAMVDGFEKAAGELKKAFKNALSKFDD